MNRIAKVPPLGNDAARHAEGCQGWQVNAPENSIEGFTPTRQDDCRRSPYPNSRRPLPSGGGGYRPCSSTHTSRQPAWGPSSHSRRSKTRSLRPCPLSAGASGTCQPTQLASPSISGVTDGSNAARKSAASTKGCCPTRKAAGRHDFRPRNKGRAGYRRASHRSAR